MEMNDTTNPEAEAPEAEAPEVDTEDSENLAADEADENAAEGDEAPEEEEELDIDGNPLKVPKTLAEKLKARMMMQADYTQKTQALAEQRREIEAQRQAVQWEREMEGSLSKETAQLDAVRSRLEQFQNVNWQELAQTNPQQAIALQAEYTQLKDFNDSLSGQIEGRRQQLAAMREQATAISVERAVAALSQPDPTNGWDGKFDADKSRKMTDFLMSKGANPEVLRTILDPLSIKIINLAMIGDETLRKQSATLKKPAPVANPVPQVNTGKTRATVNPDKMTADQWREWREEQIKRKQQRSR